MTQHTTLPYPARPYALTLRRVLHLLDDPENSAELGNYAVVVDFEEGGYRETRNLRWDHERRLCVLEIA